MPDDELHTVSNQFPGHAYRLLRIAGVIGNNEPHLLPKYVVDRYWKRNTAMRRLIAIAVFMFAAALGSPAGADVLIGVAGPMTGKDAWPGEQMQRGAELAVADINAAGGVLGQQVQLIAADDFCDPEQAVAAAQKLVSRGCDLRRRTLLLRSLDPGFGSLRGGGRPADFAGVDQSDVDRAGPRQRLPRHRPRRCGGHRGRQLPGRSLGRQEDRDPS